MDWQPTSEQSDYVLIVDDEAPVRDLLASQIGYLGHPCRVASSAEEAIEVCRQYPHPALVLSDVHMPGANGVELLHILKKLDENIQVVMVSGLSDLETVRSCLREGAYDYLIKPFELDNLSNVVLRGIERYRLLRENEEYRLHLERMVEEQTREMIAWCIEHKLGWETGYFNCPLIRRADDRLLGRVGLNLFVESTGVPEIEWTLGSAYWGRGYATEVGRAILGYGFQRAGFDEILGFARPEHAASRRVMQKLGLSYTGDREHAGLPYSFYRALQSTWRSSPDR